MADDDPTNPTPVADMMIKEDVSDVPPLPPDDVAALAPTLEEMVEPADAGENIIPPPQELHQQQQPEIEGLVEHSEQVHNPVIDDGVGLVHHPLVEGHVAVAGVVGIEEDMQHAPPIEQHAVEQAIEEVMHPPTDMQPPAHVMQQHPEDPAQQHPVIDDVVHHPVDEVQHHPVDDVVHHPVDEVQQHTVDDVVQHHPVDDVVHQQQPTTEDTSVKDTSDMIAAAAAAAVASGIDGDGAMDDATAAALAVKADDDGDKDDMMAEDEESKAKRNEQRRKRYREKTDEGSMASMGSKSTRTHEEQLASRRTKDRERYAAMTPKQRQVYNTKRRDQYHRQSEDSRQKRRERERNRYHALEEGESKDRNCRRAKLERERYQRLSSTELESKNRKRRERAADLRKRSKGGSAGSEPTDGYTLGEATAATMETETVPKIEAPPAASEMVPLPPVPVVEHVQQQVGVDVNAAAAAEEAVKEAVKEAVDEAVGTSELVIQI